MVVEFDPQHLAVEKLCPPEQLAEGIDDVGDVEVAGGGRKLYRFRCKDYRIYFEKSGDIIVVRCILNKNSKQDFLYRTKVPINKDQLLEENPNFWKLVEGAPKK